VKLQVLGDDWVATEDSQIIHLQYVHRIYLREPDEQVFPRRFQVVADLPGVRVNLTTPKAEEEATKALAMLAERLSSPLYMLDMGETR